MALSDTALIVAKQLGRVDAAGTTITDLETEIKEEIGNAIKHYNRAAWHLTEVRSGTLTTVSGTTWYNSVDLTSGAGDQSVTGRTAVDTNQIVKIHYMRENPGGSGLNEPLFEIPYTRFEAMREGSVPQGQPEYWTFYAGEIGIWPTPNAALTIYWSGIVKPVVPTSDSDTSVWLTEANELIEAAAAGRVCMKYLRDVERAAAFQATEREWAAQLEREYVSKSSSGRIRAHG